MIITDPPIQTGKIPSSEMFLHKHPVRGGLLFFDIINPSY